MVHDIMDNFVHFLVQIRANIIGKMKRSSMKVILVLFFPFFCTSNTLYTHVCWLAVLCHISRRVSATDFQSARQRQGVNQDT